MDLNYIAKWLFNSEEADKHITTKVTIDTTVKIPRKSQDEILIENL
jgi:hypothetical protein